MIRLFGNKYIQHDFSQSVSVISSMVQDIRGGERIRELSGKVNAFRQPWRKMMKFSRDVLFMKSGIGIASEGRLARVMRNTLQYRSNYIRMLSHPRQYTVMAKSGAVLKRPPHVYNTLKKITVLQSKARKMSANSGFTSKMLGLYRGAARTMNDFNRIRNKTTMLVKSGVIKKVGTAALDALKSLKYLNGRLKWL